MIFHNCLLVHGDMSLVLFTGIAHVHRLFTLLCAGWHRYCYYVSVNINDNRTFHDEMGLYSRRKTLWQR